MVTTCNSAASAIRITNRACRVGGGGKARGSSSVSLMLRVRALAVIAHTLHRELFRLEIRVRYVRRVQLFRTFSNAQADAAIFPPASRSMPASAGTRRSLCGLVGA